MAKLRTLARAIGNPKGPEAFALAVKAFRTFFRQKYPFHWPDLDWLSDQAFWDVLARYDEEGGFNAHRRKLLYEFACHAVRRIEGDTAECGSFKGLGSHLVCTALRDFAKTKGRRHYIFDSFQGLSAPNADDGHYWSKGDLACDEATVRANLAEFDFVEYKRGWIPARFVDVTANRFCFVHIDVDLAQPSKHSIDFFFPRLNTGGILIVDDYGFGTCPGVTSVVEDFIARTPQASLLRSPVGGGVIVKTADVSQSEAP